MRLGVLGGTFDPIHYAHLLVGEEAADRFDLEHVIFVPNALPPHKAREVAAPEDRFEMTRLATDANSHFDVSRVELDRPGRSYTVDTLAALRSRWLGAELFFITGTDALADISTWRTPERVAEQCVFVAVERDDWPMERLARTLPDYLVGRVLSMPPIPLAISSTDIRRRVRESRPIRYLTPDPVVSYISTHGLYR